MSNLEALLVEVHSKWTAALDQYRSFDETILTKNPAEDQWSPVDILEHLYLVESSLQKVLTSSVKKTNKLNKAGSLTKLRAALASLVLRMPLKLKIPSDVVRPSGTLSFSDMEKRANELHSGWMKLLPELSKHATDKELFRHPIAGWLSAEGAVSFLNTHFTHHQRQIQETLEVLST